jgi:hypothetical protein
MIMPTAPFQPDKSPKRDSTALAFLIAMGIALATTAGAALTAAGTGTLGSAMGAVSLGTDPAVAADRTQEAAAVARLEDRLDDLLGEVEILKLRPSGPIDQTVIGRLSQLDQDVAQVKADTKRLQSGIDGAAWRDEIGSFRANFANTDIELGKLRASFDERDDNRRRAIADLSRRMEHLERVVAASEDTGSIPSALRHRARPARAGLSGWSVQDGQFDHAVIAGQGGRYSVWPGTMVPGLGRVVSVRQRGSRWMVVTDKGVILQRSQRESAPDALRPPVAF